MRLIDHHTDQFISIESYSVLFFVLYFCVNYSKRTVICEMHSIHFKFAVIGAVFLVISYQKVHIIPWRRLSWISIFFFFFSSIFVVVGVAVSKVLLIEVYLFWTQVSGHDEKDKNTEQPQLPAVPSLPTGPITDGTVNCVNVRMMHFMHYFETHFEYTCICIMWESF